MKQFKKFGETALIVIATPLIILAILVWFIIVTCQTVYYRLTKQNAKLLKHYQSMYQLLDKIQPDSASNSPMIGKKITLKEGAKIYTKDGIKIYTSKA